MDRFNKKKKEELDKVVLNPVCSAFKEYNMKYYNEPYVNFHNEISWMWVLGPQTAYVKGRDVNDKKAYNLKLK